MDITQRINSIQEVQDAIKGQLEKNVYFAASKITVLSENSAQIDFLIKNAIGKLGIVCVVQTPVFEFYGKDGDGHPVWNMPEATIVISEIPTVNRARAGASTALDAALQAAESLNELGSGIKLSQIYQMENQGVVSVFVTFETSAHFTYERKDLSPTD
jgi:hypothetical protein